MLLMELPGNDRVFRYMRSAVIFFGGKRKVLSTAPLNGDAELARRGDNRYAKGLLKSPTGKDHTGVLRKDDNKKASCFRRRLQAQFTGILPLGAAIPGANG